MSGPGKKYGDVIGLVPAAGQASRLSPLPCSKELIPVGFHSCDNSGRSFPKVAAHFLFERLRRAGISKAYVILRKGKWDIPAYFGDGSSLGMDIAYLIMGLPYGTPYTLDQAWPFIRNARVALGFPDIIFEPDNAFVPLLEHQEQTGADVVLGLFPSGQPDKMDMVETDVQGKVLRIVIKPKQTKLKYSWMIALWTPKFTAFMHHYLAQVVEQVKAAQADKKAMKRELYLGDVIQAGLASGLRVEAKRFSNGSCIDLGTPADLAQAIVDYGTSRL
ncbi:MAG: dTDP-glucose pyrophosphorylase [Gammaproteobacteria bacterium]|nr:dTDP-glucose pyrophosphorylase [Gammaproteobacteria bacterium]